ncbi:hypothetical protein [Desulfosporosinus youngiae]|uniref:hypothetical protein n=1 Tax=Desulfosporosinus youngiae TaxID=339862 RepID=UPI0005A6FE41|nr:hypothetical protein [Desulfosporosinus youngiae]
MSIYERFLVHLQTCGGCTGLRNVSRCRYALACSQVERLARKGVVKNSEDFTDLDYLSITKPAKLRTTAPGTGPCETD